MPDPKDYIVQPANVLGSYLGGVQARQQQEQGVQSNALLRLQQDYERQRTEASRSEMTAQRRAELLKDMAAAVKWADTPEKWDQAVSVFVADGNKDAEQYRGRFGERDLIAAQIASHLGGGKPQHAGPYVLPPGAALVDPTGGLLRDNPVTRPSTKPTRRDVVHMESPKGGFVTLNANDPTIGRRQQLGWKLVRPDSEIPGDEAPDAPSFQGDALPSNAPPAPIAAASPTSAEDTIRQAQEAIKQGADPSQVAERLQRLGIDPRVLQSQGVARGLIRRDVARPLER